MAQTHSALTKRERQTTGLFQRGHATVADVLEGSAGKVVATREEAP
jgi:hypothetical protein